MIDTIVMQDLVTRELAGLGDTANAIAAKLYSYGVTGKTESSTDCPISHYLIIKTGLSAFTSQQCIIMGYNACLVVTPEPVAEFISLFDKRGYPYLIMRNVEPQLWTEAL